MKKICFYDTKPYDKIYFDQLKEKYCFEIEYFESKLNSNTAIMASGSDAVIAFVNDTIDKKVIDILHDNGVKMIAMRCAGYNNVDLKAAYHKIHVVRVPAYSPYAIAEYTMALLLMLNRKIHRAYNRIKEFNFSLNGLIGFDLYGKTIGIIGTGKIGKIFINICKGFGLQVLAYDPYPIKNSDINYVSFEELCKNSDIISLHCPLTKDTHYIINKESIALMKDGIYILNTSRGALIDSDVLLDAIRSGKIGGAALDVYEEETDFFYEDMSFTIINDEVLMGLISMPNVIVSSHQAFLTHEALQNIAQTTLDNLNAYFTNGELKNIVCAKCPETTNQ